VVERERLLETLRSLPTSRAARGDADSRAGLVATEQYVFDELRALGLEPRFEAFEWAGHQWRNVIVDLGGLKDPAEVLIFSAHLDAVVGSPGADDDGTGVSALLEAARVLRDAPLERTLRLCFFNLEEVGLIGSRHHASIYQEVIKAGDERCVGMVSIDMIGYFTDEPGSQQSPFPRIEGVFEPRTVGDFVALVGVRRDAYFIQRLEEEMEAGAEGLIVERADFSPIPLPDLMRSDHAPFYVMGIPAVMMTDTANFRSPHYHRSTDTIETIDMDRFELTVRGLVAAMRILTRVKGDGQSGETTDDPK
jgi:Zn-dependent M28 family amino/carboxypeptidase